jgi:hypothetical protein
MMNEQKRISERAPTVIAALEQSRADLVAGHVDDFDEYLERLNHEIEDRAAELERKREASSNNG